MFGASAEMDEKAETLLVMAAESFLRSGGRLSREAHEALSPISRAAFEVAGNRIDERRAEMIASLIVAAIEQVADVKARKILEEVSKE